RSAIAGICPSPQRRHNTLSHVMVCKRVWSTMTSPATETPEMMSEITDMGFLPTVSMRYPPRNAKMTEGTATAAATRPAAAGSPGLSKTIHGHTMPAIELPSADIPAEPGEIQVFTIETVLDTR